MVPNSDIYTGAVTVRTAFPRRRCEVGIGHGDDITAACNLIVETLLNVEGVENDPTPEAFAWTLAGSSVNIKLRWWSDPTQISMVRTQSRFIAAIKKALSEAGIDLSLERGGMDDDCDPLEGVILHDPTPDTAPARK